ncbi:MAG TPA: hypothetical protein VFO86_13310, partial [Terriglobia bacterium]|nr:hypothetical protein [Terriglobia bacterium]
MTIRQANDVIKKHIKQLELNGRCEDALEMLNVLIATQDATRKEFEALPLAKKCDVWRSTGWGGRELFDLCSAAMDSCLGADWRDDPTVLSVVAWAVER